MNTNKEKNIIFVRLDKGEEIFESLYRVINKYDIKSGIINGIGAINNVVIGSYNPKTKDYNKIKFEDNFELTSLIGNVSLKNKKPFLHIHVNISDEKCQAFGGHLFSADILATGELKIFATETKVSRKYNEEIGLFLWDLGHCEK